MLAGRAAAGIEHRPVGRSPLAAGRSTGRGIAAAGRASLRRIAPRAIATGIAGRRPGIARGRRRSFGRIPLAATGLGLATLPGSSRAAARRVSPRVRRRFGSFTGGISRGALARSGGRAATRLRGGVLSARAGAGRVRLLAASLVAPATAVSPFRALAFRGMAPLLTGRTGFARPLSAGFAAAGFRTATTLRRFRGGGSFVPFLPGPRTRFTPLGTADSILRFGVAFRSGWVARLAFGTP